MGIFSNSGKKLISSEKTSKKADNLRKTNKLHIATEESLKKRISFLEQKLKQKSFELESIKANISKPKEISKKHKNALLSVAKSEKMARIRLEKQLNFAHTKILKIEAEMQRLKRASKLKQEETVKDIRGRLFDLINDYKGRFK